MAPNERARPDEFHLSACLKFRPWTGGCTCEAYRCLDCEAGDCRFHWAAGGA